MPARLTVFPPIDKDAEARISVYRAVSRDSSSRSGLIAGSNAVTSVSHNRTACAPAATLHLGPVRQRASNRRLNEVSRSAASGANPSAYSRAALAAALVVSWENFKCTSELQVSNARRMASHVCKAPLRSPASSRRSSAAYSAVRPALSGVAAEMDLNAIMPAPPRSVSPASCRTVQNYDVPVMP